jgi:4-hydroxybenzoate polyprenyltransferase
LVAFSFNAFKSTIMNSKSNNSGIMAWLRLLRISNVPTAISNILMAFLLVHQSWSPGSELVFLILASSSLYLAGMVLNDVFDLEIDAAQRPTRPLPANEISKTAAVKTGVGLLLVGILLAGFAGWIANQGASAEKLFPVWRPGLIAVLLALLIFLYDGPLKRTAAAPLLMGGCRTLNILLGASTFVAVQDGAQPGAGFFLGLPLIVWWVAVAIGILITGATLLGRKEAVKDQARMPLFLAGVLVLIGLASLAFVVYCPTSSFEIPEQQKNVFPLFIGLISLTIARRVIEAVFTAQPQKIQMGVVSILRSLIIFDAAICYLAAPGQIGYALVVLALLVPSILLARFIPAT